MAGIIYTTQEQIEAMRQEIEAALRAEEEQKAGKNKVKIRSRVNLAKKIANAVLFSGLVLFLMVALVNVLLEKNRGEIPSLFGYQLYTVQSGSMAPTLKVGAIIISKKTDDPYSLQAGDVVTFRTEQGTIVTHRIIEVVTEKSGRRLYRTKGDNPINSPDRELLAPEDIVAVFVAKVPLT